MKNRVVRAGEQSRMKQVVWFKRDLRVHDHRPLATAARSGEVLALYVFERALWRQPDRSARHLTALHAQLRDLDAQLAELALQLAVLDMPMIDALRHLREQYGTFRLLAHEETGTDWTYRRDLEVVAWCRAHGIEFVEVPQFGVIRALKDRNGWASRWDRTMNEPLTPPPRGARAAPWPAAALRVADLALKATDTDLLSGQDMGRAAAVADLDSFLRRRGEGYRRNMSSPIEGEAGCSRLSVHLSLGTLSMREVWQATRRRRDQVLSLAPERRGTWAEDLASFQGRLHWHCHFIQKLETDPSIEYRNLSRACDGLREAHFDEARFRAWCRGETGYPYIDACMRYLRATGWLNFRARAMLMSFAAYDLWLHWPAPAQELARLFLDYEPGIHYSQVQMQSGTTGINTLRIYNPVKQGFDHDPQARFIAAWVPELAHLPPPLRHEPWKMTPIEQASSEFRLGTDYPERVVDHAAAARQAHAAIGARRRDPEARAEAGSIHGRHGSRRRRRR